MGISRSNFTLGRNVIVWPTFSTDIKKVLPNTKGTSLIIGHNDLLGVEPVFWASPTVPSLAVLGFGSDQDLQIVGQVSMLGADPFTTATELGGLSSIRLLAALPIARWDIYSETRQRSVLIGFSTLGGLSAFLNSVFAIIFGGSIVFVLFDVKPLSIFGLLHRFSNVKLSQQYKEDFPQLLDEGGPPGRPTSGLVAFIREYLVDFSSLQLETEYRPLVMRGEATGAPRSDDTDQFELGQRSPLISGVIFSRDEEWT